MIAGVKDARFSISAEVFAKRAAALPRPAVPAHLDDLYLAVCCAEGDESAWRECLATHRPFMIEFARQILGDAGAPDLVDQVIADLWERRKMARYEGRSALRTWLGAVVAHAALNQQRARASEARAVQAATRLPDTAASHAAGREREVAGVLQTAIGRLAPAERTLVLLYYEQGLTLDQASRVLGQSKSTLSRDLKTARARIRTEADRIARERLGRPLDVLREDVNLDRLDLNLREACAGASDENAGAVSNEREP
jgi:RNA polymerase sigma-70 factor, ECF subfamily